MNNLIIDDSCCDESLQNQLKSYKIGVKNSGSLLNLLTSHKNKLNLIVKNNNYELEFRRDNMYLKVIDTSLANVAARMLLKILKEGYFKHN